MFLPSVWSTVASNINLLSRILNIVKERNGKGKMEKSRILGNVGINCAAGG